MPGWDAVITKRLKETDHDGFGDRKELNAWFLPTGGRPKNPAWKPLNVVFPEFKSRHAIGELMADIAKLPGKFRSNGWRGDQNLELVGNQ